MVILVVFIHSFGLPADIDIELLHSDPISSSSLYNFLRITLTKVISQVAVPVFFMTSGYYFFFKVKQWNGETYLSKMRKRFKTLVVPYLLWNTLFMMVALTVQTINSGSIDNLWQVFLDNGGLRIYFDQTYGGHEFKNWFGYERPMSYPLLYPLWFVRDLIVLNLLTPIIYWMIRKFGSAFLLSIMFLYISGVWVNIPGLTAVAVFWFTLGAYLGINKKDIVVTIRKFEVPCCIITLLTMFPLIWYGGSMGNRLAMVLYPIYVTSATVSAVNISSRLVEGKRVAVYPLLAKATFFVFASHVFVLLVTRKVYPLFTNSVFFSTLYYLAEPLIVVAVCVLVYRIMERFTPKFLALLTGGRAF